MATDARPSGGDPANGQSLQRPARQDSPSTTKVLALAYFFAPDARTASLRNTKILRHLPEHGITLTVATIAEELCVDRNLGRDLLETVPPQAQLIRTRCVYPFAALGRVAAKVRTTAPGSGRAKAAGVAASERNRAARGRWQRIKDVVSYSLAVPDFYCGWLPYALHACVQEVIEDPPDVIYAVGLPWTSFVAGYLLKVLLRRPLVIDFMDPWARAEWSDRPPFFRRLDERMEAFFVRRADHVIANTEEVAEDFHIRLGVPQGKLSVLTCGFDPSELPQPAERGRDEVFTLSHIGTLYGERNPRNLLAALQAAVARGAIPPSGIRVNFVGRLEIQDPELERLRASPPLSGMVHWLPWLPQPDALRIVAESDMALVIQPRHGLAIPAKLYEYAGLKKPVLALADPASAIDRLLRRERWGEAVPNEDLAAIQEKLISLYRSHREGRIGEACFWDGRSRYTVQHLAGRLAEILRRHGRRHRQARMPGPHELSEMKPEPWR